MSPSQLSILLKKFKCINLNFDNLNDESDVDWSKEKLLKLLRSKLLTNYDEETYNDLLNTMINRGVYSEIVVSKLLKNGMSKENIVKAMKRGFMNLQPCELCPFQIFNVTPDTLCNHEPLQNDFDKELTAKLKIIGISREESLKIILFGLTNQSDCCLFRLTLNNIVTTKILNWQGPPFCPTNKMIYFLKNLGSCEDIIEIILKNGISEEALEVLDDLGFSEFDEKDRDEICSRDIEENSEERCSTVGSLIKQDVQKNMSESKENIISEKTNYLRQNLMAPLTWALSRTLKYNPTDPIHFVACQLMRWKYYIDSGEQNKILNYVNDATAKKQH